MVRNLIRTFICVVAVWSVGTVQADADEIKDQLDKAKAAYDEDIKSARESLLSVLDLRIESAQKLGDLQLLKRLKADRQLFADSDELPQSVSVREHATSTGVARRRLEAAYLKAVKEFTKADKIKEADVTEKELQAFKDSGRAKKKPAPPNNAPTREVREIWIHDTGYFMKGVGKDWFEKYHNGNSPPNLFVEVVRTQDFIELRHRQAQTTVRILSDKALARDDTKKLGFKPIYNGCWLEEPSGDSQ